jgi:hypothetical protein
MIPSGTGNAGRIAIPGLTPAWDPGVIAPVPGGRGDPAGVFGFDVIP